MADLFDRLFTDENKIAVHAFHAAVADYASGNTTRAQIISVWSLDSSAQIDLNALLDDLDALSTKVDKIEWMMNFDAVCIIAEGGYKYNTKSAFKTRMGL